jgi:hypothetical protein
MKDLVQLFKESHIGNIKRETEVVVKKLLTIDEQSLPRSSQYTEDKTKELSEVEVIKLKIQKTLNKAA